MSLWPCYHCVGSRGNVRTAVEQDSRWLRTESCGEAAWRPRLTTGGRVIPRRFERLLECASDRSISLGFGIAWIWSLPSSVPRRQFSRSCGNWCRTRGLVGLVQPISVCHPGHAGSSPQPIGSEIASRGTRGLWHASIWQPPKRGLLPLFLWSSQRKLSIETIKGAGFTRCAKRWGDRTQGVRGDAEKDGRTGLANQRKRSK